MHDLEKNEALYRKIPFNPIMTDKTGRISSAAFKDSIGCSVDRNGDRDLETCKECIINRFEYDNVQAIVSVTVSNCDEKNAYIKQCPVDDNEYHCEILRSHEEVQLTQSQAKYLASRAAVVHTHKNSSIISSNSNI